MRLSAGAVIAAAKVRNYLLAWRPENDKSGFLSQAGYTVLDADRLEQDIRQLLNLEAEFGNTTDYGDTYRIEGFLKGPNGNVLEVVSIWMVERATGNTKFITLYPRK